MEHVLFRPATVTDATQVADVYLASRKAFVSFAPLVHADDAVRRWVAAQLIPAGGVTVAVSAGGVGPVVGLMAVSHHTGVGWIDHLYLHPAAVGRGLGSRLVVQAQTVLGPPIRLYTFQANTRARRFYERHGFRAVAWGDGSGNEEGCPDVLYAWSPVASLRPQAQYPGL